MRLVQTTLSRRDSLKIARRFNAGNGSAYASSPAGTAENARTFRSSLWDKTAGASLSVERVSIAFPLTPALSLRERVNPAPSLGMAGDGIRADGSRITESIQSLFPLPKGEGQGEGKARERMKWN
jgi:hypothetical protein